MKSPLGCLVEWCWWEDVMWMVSELCTVQWKCSWIQFHLQLQMPGWDRRPKQDLRGCRARGAHCKLLASQKRKLSSLGAIFPSVFRRKHAVCYEHLFFNLCSVFTGIPVNVCACAVMRVVLRWAIFLPLGWCVHSAEENDVERLGTQGGMLNF